MKSINLLIVFLTLTITLFSQQNTVSAGGEASGSNGNISFSIGQIDYVQATGTGGNLEQGLQHAFVTPCNIIITPTVTNATCGNASGSATVSITGAAAPYTTQWSSGSFNLTTDGLAAGQYVFQVTDANGCYNSAVVNINNTNGPSINTASITNVSCPGGNNGAISISATAGTTPYTYLWSNGATTSSITSLYTGVYDVTVTDATNCVAIQTYTVSQPTPLNLNFSSTAATCGANDGSLTANITGGTTPYTYLWSANAASQTTATAVNLSAGIYSCVVTDTKGCQTSGFGAVASAVSGPALSFTKTDAAGCGNSNGGSIDLTVTGGSGFTYQWSNGAITEDISNLAPGNYLVVVTNTTNCSSTGSVTILNASANTNPSVCIVTVDSLTGTNQIVWEKPATANGIKFYKIYREGSALGVYNLIHTQAFSTLSEYVDITANPAVRGWRYKITYEDSCGNETVLSTHHKTIHLMVNKGLGNVMNLSWDQYEGFAYQTFYIWRRHASTGWVQIDALPSNLFSYTDLNPPGTGTLRYMIELAPTSGYVCNSSAKLPAATINTTRSNTKDKIIAPDPVDGITENNLSYLNIYPNPVTDVLHITTSNKIIQSVKIFDITGRLIIAQVTENNSSKTQINTIYLSSGMYVVEVSANDGRIRRPFVKQ